MGKLISRRTQAAKIVCVCVCVLHFEFLHRFNLSIPTAFARSTSNSGSRGIHRAIFYSHITSPRFLSRVLGISIPFIVPRTAIPRFLSPFWKIYITIEITRSARVCPRCQECRNVAYIARIPAGRFETRDSATASSSATRVKRNATQHAMQCAFIPVESEATHSQCRITAEAREAPAWNFTEFRKLDVLFFF